MGNETSSPAIAIMEGVETGVRETNRHAPRVLDSAGRTVGYLWDQHAPQAVKSMPSNAADAVINAVGSIPRKMERQQRDWDRTIERLPENTKRRADNVVASLGPAANFCRQKTADISNYAYESWDNLPEETKDTIKEGPERAFAFCYSIPRKTVRVIERIDACGLNPCYEPTMMGKRSKLRRSSKESFVQSLGEDDQINDPYRGFEVVPSADHLVSQLSDSRREDESNQSQIYHSQAYKSSSSPRSERHNTPASGQSSNHSGSENKSKGNTFAESDSASEAASQNHVSADDGNSHISREVSYRGPSREPNSYVSRGHASGAPSQSYNHNGSHGSGDYASRSPSKGIANYYIGSSPSRSHGSEPVSSLLGKNTSGYLTGGFGSGQASEQNLFSPEYNGAYVYGGLNRDGGSSKGGPNSIFAPNNRYSRLSKVSKSQSGADHRSKLASQLEEGGSYYSSSPGSRRVIDGGQYTQEDIFQMMKGDTNMDGRKYSGIHSMVFHQSNVTMNEPVIMSGKPPGNASSSSHSSSM